MTPGDELAYVSRGGWKLEHALAEFGISPAGLWAADLGCSTGGFTDCLLKHGADRVFSVDTAYGELAWTLRNDPRVTVMERTNAIHSEPHEDASVRGGVDLVVIDLGWTRQSKALPVALRWLKPTGSIVTLVKPHYEAPKGALGPGGVLEPGEPERIAEDIRMSMSSLGVRELGWTRSPVLGGAVSGKKKRRGSGNPEWLAWIEPIPG